MSSPFSSHPKTIVILGAGPAGVTAAFRLAQAGQRVTLYESSHAVGGMARTIDLWGQKVDLGPHRFFSDDRRVNDLWLEVVKEDYAMVDRQTRIFYRDRFFSYPLSPTDALSKLGLLEGARCGLSYLRQKLSPAKTKSETFADWVTRRFGRRLFEIFFEGYSTKLWGIPPSEIDADFASQRIKQLSLWQMVKHALTAGRGNQHKSLVDVFAYPTGGTGMVYERMADAIRKTPGCSVQLGRKIDSLRVRGGRVTGIYLGENTVQPCDVVISTMPIPHLVTALGDVPAPVTAAASELTFRNTILVYLLVDGIDLFPDQWLYIQSPTLKVGRVTNFRNWVPSLYGKSDKTILAAEFWCDDSDPVWREEEATIASHAKQELTSTGLLGGKQVLEAKVIRVPRCYPVYKRGYRQRLKIVTDYLDQFRGLMPIGRGGAFKYNNQDHSILMGILAAESIVSGERADLWSVNTDYTTYQEGTAISQTGFRSRLQISSR